MLLSTQTEVTSARFGHETAVEMICDAGFEAIDLSLFDMLRDGSYFSGDDYLIKAELLKKIANSHGRKFNQAHAPFPCYRVNDEEYNEKIAPALIKAIEIAGVIEADQIIIHPVYVEENKKQFNMDLYNGLLDTAKKAGVKIALENMFSWKPEKGFIANVCSLPEEFADYVSSLDPNYFTACLDIGHCGLIGEDEANMIRVLGHDRLTALHIHDNDHKGDNHTIPFTRSIDFKAVAKALKDIDYVGDLTLEADNFIINMPDSLILDGLKFMRKADAALREMILNA